jgi:hypothetical protein
MMAIIICDKHGRQGCPRISPGVLKAMKENKPTDIIYMIFRAQDFDEDFDWQWGLYMKKEELGVPPFTGVLDEKGEVMVFDDDDQLDKIFCKFKIVCMECFREFMLSGGPEMAALPWISREKSL